MFVVDGIPPAASCRHYIKRVTATSPRRARHWAQEVLATTPGLIDTALIAISELVTNVALYAPGSGRLTIRATDHGVEIAMADHRADGIPDPIDEPDWTAEHQRGLVLLKAFSASGITVRHARRWGKEVVVVLATDTPKEADCA